jgi:hypothetical protein
MHPNRARPYPTGYYGVVTVDRRPKAAMEALAEAFGAAWARAQGEAAAVGDGRPTEEMGAA